MTVESTSDRGTLPVPYFALVLGLIVFIIAALGGWFYTGLIGRLGDWQFANFGLYFNIASIFIFVALLALIWRIGRLLVQRDRSNEDEIESNEIEDLQKNLLRTTLAKMITRWIGLGFVFSGFITLIYLVLLPSTDMKTRAIEGRLAISGPEGPVELRGVRAVGPTARYRQGFLFWARTYYFMPIAMEKNQNQVDEATVFLEVPANLAKSSLAISAEGILRNGTLPDEVASMYSDAKFPVAEGASVIFANASSSDWGSRVLLYETLLLGIFSLLFSWFLNRREKRLEKEIANH